MSRLKKISESMNLGGEFYLIFVLKYMYLNKFKIIVYIFMVKLFWFILILIFKNFKVVL